jgi:branched-chain amino acid transport system ATP-binding protein
MLTIARTLSMNPELLLLDEPAEGLAPIIVKEMEVQLAKVKKDGMTMILTEQQHLKFVESLADSAYIIDKGQIRFQGSVSEIMADAELKKKYLAV